MSRLGIVVTLRLHAKKLLPFIAMENAQEVLAGKAVNDHIHMFISYPQTQNIYKIKQWLKGIIFEDLAPEVTASLQAILGRTSPRLHVSIRKLR
jgi:REP element-mobilizing transposase RayT